MPVEMISEIARWLEHKGLDGGGQDEPIRSLLSQSEDSQLTAANEDDARPQGGITRSEGQVDAWRTAILQACTTRLVSQRCQVMLTWSYAQLDEKLLLTH